MEQDYKKLALTSFQRASELASAGEDNIKATISFLFYQREVRERLKESDDVLGISKEQVQALDRAGGRNAVLLNIRHLAQSGNFDQWTESLGLSEIPGRTIKERQKDAFMHNVVRAGGVTAFGFKQDDVNALFHKAADAATIRNIAQNMLLSGESAKIVGPILPLFKQSNVSAAIPALTAV